MNVTGPVKSLRGLPNWSAACTVTINALPAVTVLMPMALTKNSLKTGTLTAMGPVVAVMLDVAVSVADKVWVPTVLNVARKCARPVGERRIVERKGDRAIRAREMDGAGVTAAGGIVELIQGGDGEAYRHAQGSRTWRGYLEMSSGQRYRLQDYIVAVASNVSDFAPRCVPKKFGMIAPSGKLLKVPTIGSVLSLAIKT